MSRNLLALDQGTSSTRAVLFNSKCDILDIDQKELTQFFPKNGWVEHDPEEIWKSAFGVMESVISKNESVAAIGITNQRETTIVWNSKTGKPIYPAIVWQDRRTADYCDFLRNQGLEETITRKTGLLLDPYFSATKLRWILDHVSGARDKARQGSLLFGTVDSFLLWKLTDGRSHKTDAANASRTMLFNIYEQVWDMELLEMFDIPRQMLPEVADCSSYFGSTVIFGDEIPITGMAGDQQAALIGQCCFSPGMLKSTYGTGCFAILNTGDKAIISKNKLLTTVAYRLAGEVTYALEGSIFIAGAAVQWLRDGLGLIENAESTDAIAESNPDTNGVYLVPAFTGLGAPYWDANARGGLLGLSRNTTSKDLVTATLQSVCFQTRDLFSAMEVDGANLSLVRVDGGMVTNDWFVQALADLTQISVDRANITETTSLGAAFLAGLEVGLFKSLEDFESYRVKTTTVVAEIDNIRSDQLYAGWQNAVARIRTSY